MDEAQGEPIPGDRDASGIARHLEHTRAALDRLTPDRAFEEWSGGALLIDTRTFEQRRVQGDVPGAMCIDRTVLEWRLDPAEPWHIPEAESRDVRIIVMCRHGYSSSLAAASLQAIGLHRATDIVGGFEAWHAAGLPVTPFTDPGDPR